MEKPLKHSYDSKSDHLESSASKSFDTHSDVENLPVILGDKHTTAAALSLSTSTLKHYRLAKDSTLIQGIHYYVINPRMIRYNITLMVHWLLHQNEPHEHQRAIEAYLAKMAQMQSSPRKCRRRS